MEKYKIKMYHIDGEFKYMIVRSDSEKFCYGGMTRDEAKRELENPLAIDRKVKIYQCFSYIFILVIVICTIGLILSR